MSVDAAVGYGARRALPSAAGRAQRQVGNHVRISSRSDTGRVHSSRYCDMTARSPRAELLHVRHLEVALHLAFAPDGDPRASSGPSASRPAPRMPSNARQSTRSRCASSANDPAATLTTRRMASSNRASGRMAPASCALRKSGSPAARRASRPALKISELRSSVPCMACLVASYPMKRRLHASNSRPGREIGHLSRELAEPLDFLCKDGVVEVLTRGEVPVQRSDRHSCPLSDIL